MNFKNINEIKSEGFVGFKTVGELWENSSCIPKSKGVYLVLDTDKDNPQFINPGTGGYFKGKNPNISIEELKTNYVSNSLVVYIGKAGTPTGKATLNSRLRQCLRFGRGKNVGHWGGRLIWQMMSHKDLIICWKPTPGTDPREVEKVLINEYKLQFGRLPFANLSR